MLSKIFTGALNGLDSEVITVEADLTAGLPNLIIVGLPDMSVRESKERIRSAILNSFGKYPSKRITINLSPANIKKEGTYFDLPIAVSILTASLVKNKDFLKSYAFLGELSLGGQLCRINGAVPLVIGIRNSGIKNVVVPKANAKEVSLVKDINIFPVESLKDLKEFLTGKAMLKPFESRGDIIDQIPLYNEDFSDVAGQESVKRSLQIGAAGCHGILMIGPPGAGKTMIAKRIPTILPEMTYEEILEVTKIYSIAGELTEEKPVIKCRPFRSPHHTVSAAGLAGGGGKPLPGEVSLAHFGVLFLDELPEFKRNVLELLRQPLEEDKITISRARGTTIYPSKIMVVAAMNPCPCGYYGDTTHQCTCTPYQIQNYMNRISGPLLDRIDIHLEILPVKYKEIAGVNFDNNLKIKKTSSEEMRKQVIHSREIQLERYKNLSIKYNSQLTPSMIKKYCVFDNPTKKLLEEAFGRLSLSARAYIKIIKLSRTIADMEGSDKIEFYHVAEAIQSRDLTSKYRGI